MSCFPVSIDGPSGVSDVLRGVDCETGRVTQLAFERIFGIHGALGFALTALLSIYVALLAVSLLTGRSTMRLSLLTPRALTIGLVLTFATSWVAYQQVVWNLAAGAPDQIAGIVIGSHGSAVHLFAAQLDRLFAAVVDAAKAASTATAAAHQGAPFAPADLLWLSAMLLLLGTAGVLIVARIALAAMLAIGPLFIVLALFESLRGLFEGWLKGVILFAVVPLLTVLVGGGALLLLDPTVKSLTLSGDLPSMQLALGVFMGACIYTALLLMAIKAASVLTSALRLPRRHADQVYGQAPLARSPAPPPVTPVAAQNGFQNERIREIVTATQSSLSTSTSRVVQDARGVQALPYALAKGNRASSKERLHGLRARRLKKEFQS